MCNFACNDKYVYKEQTTITIKTHKNRDIVIVNKLISITEHCQIHYTFLFIEIVIKL